MRPGQRLRTANVPRGPSEEGLRLGLQQAVDDDGTGRPDRGDGGCQDIEQGFRRLRIWGSDPVERV